MELVLAVVGSVIILGLFFLNQTNKLKNDSVVYDLFNLIGALCLMMYVILTEGYPFIIINAVWGLVSLKDVVMYILKKG